MQKPSKSKSKTDGARSGAGGGGSKSPIIPSAATGKKRDQAVAQETDAENPPEQKAPKRPKGWGPEVKAMGNSKLCSLLYRMYCLDGVEADPENRYRTVADGPHKFLWSLSTNDFTSQFMSKATYDVFNDFRIFSASHQDFMARLVNAKGNLTSGPEADQALQAFRDSAPVGGEGRKSKGVRHSCEFSIKKNSSSSRGASKNTRQKVCFSASCVHVTAEGQSARIANEGDKHFAFFLHHKNDGVRAGAEVAFSRGGVLGEAYAEHYGEYYSATSNKNVNTTTTNKNVNTTTTNKNVKTTTTPKNM